MQWLFCFVRKRNLHKIKQNLFFLTYVFPTNFELSINPLSGKNLSLNECYEHVNVEKVNKMGHNKYV